MLRFLEDQPFSGRGLLGVGEVAGGELPLAVGRRHLLLGRRLVRPLREIQKPRFDELEIRLDSNLFGNAFQILSYLSKSDIRTDKIID